MSVTVAKEFRWEMGHRLPDHPLCKNVHGHSYRMVVEVEGELDEHGMVVDFGEIGCLVKPILDRLDHSFMVDASDAEMLAFLESHGLKATVVPFPSTAENIANWLADQLAPGLLDRENAGALTISVCETTTAVAEVRRGAPRA